MKLMQLLLCKTPFTPSYEHIVAGCSNKEFYDKLEQDEGTETISVELGHYSFRTPKETDNEIIIHLTARKSVGANFTILDITQFNYIATFEIDPVKFRFWFIESYEVDNALQYPSITLYCSIDYWHSYGLEGEIFNQHIIRETQNGSNLLNHYYAENNNIQHTITTVSDDRILWARARFNFIPLSEEQSSYDIGTMFDGLLVHGYVPIGIFKNGKITFNDSAYYVIYDNSRKRYTVENSSVTITDLNNDNSPHIREASLIISELSQNPYIESFDLTYLPPFNYTFVPNVVDGYNIYISDKCNELEFPVNIDQSVNMVIVDRSNKGGSIKSIVYDIDIGEQSNDPDFYFKNRYPYYYSSIVVGGTEYIFDYPVSQYKIILNNFGSGDSWSASLYVNNNLIKDNIELSLSVPLPITTSQAGEIDAIYGSGYRTSKMLTSVLSSLETGLNSFMSMQQNPVKYLNSLGSFGKLDTALIEYHSANNVPSTTYEATTASSAVVYGDYPFIIKHEPLFAYKQSIGLMIRVYGEMVNDFGTPIIKNHEYFDYVKCSGANVISTSFNKKGNDVISSAFNRGVHIWHYDNLNNLSSIGNFMVVNNNR